MKFVEICSNKKIRQKIEEIRKILYIAKEIGKFSLIISRLLYLFYNLLVSYKETLGSKSPRGRRKRSSRNLLWKACVGPGPP